MQKKNAPQELWLSLMHLGNDMSTVLELGESSAWYYFSQHVLAQFLFCSVYCRYCHCSTVICLYSRQYCTSIVLRHPPSSTSSYHCASTLPRVHRCKHCSTFYNCIDVWTALLYIVYPVYLFYDQYLVIVGCPRSSVSPVITPSCASLEGFHSIFSIPNSVDQRGQIRRDGQRRAVHSKRNRHGEERRAGAMHVRYSH